MLSIIDVVAWWPAPQPDNAHKQGYKRLIIARPLAQAQSSVSNTPCSSAGHAATMGPSLNLDRNRQRIASNVSPQTLIWVRAPWFGVVVS